MVSVPIQGRHRKEDVHSRDQDDRAPPWRNRETRGREGHCHQDCVRVGKGIPTVNLLVVSLTTGATNAVDTHISPPARTKRDSQMGPKAKWRSRVGTPGTTVNIKPHERDTQILVRSTPSERTRARQRPRRNPCSTISRVQRKPTRRTRQQ